MVEATTADVVLAVLFIIGALVFLVGGFLYVTGLWADVALAFVELFHRGRERD